MSQSQGAPQDQESPAVVFQKALTITSNVLGDEDASGLADEAIVEVDKLEDTMTARRKAGNKKILAAGKRHGAQGSTGRALRTWSKKAIAHYETDRQDGADHPEMQRLLNEKTPSTYLPSGAKDRAQAVTDLKTAIDDEKTDKEVKKLATPLLKAIAHEQAQGAAYTKAEKAEKAALEAEDDQKKKVVAAIRGLVGAVQTKFKEDPSRMREALGYSEPGGRSKSAPQDKAAKTAKAPKDEKKGKGKKKAPEDAKAKDDGEEPKDPPPEGEGEESGEE